MLTNFFHLMTTYSSTSPHKRLEVVHLPDEIIHEILSSLPKGQNSQSTLAACCLLSWQWYRMAITMLYDSPYLYGKNYDPFVRTICPSLNAHIRKSDLAGLVRTLDMGSLVHQGSRSTTARLLGRTKANLLGFVAPQANFGINCLAALSKCVKLQYLDLSLLSESISARDLAHTLQNMKNLITLKSARCATRYSCQSEETLKFSWPVNLSTLTLSGDMHLFLWTFPESSHFLPALTNLTISRSLMCPGEVNKLLKQIGPQLLHLTVNNMPNFSNDMCGHLSDVFKHCPNLLTLSVSHGFLASLQIPDREHLMIPLLTHPLQQLEIRPSDQGPNAAPAERDSYVLKPWNLYTALDAQLFPKLRKLRIARAIDWGTRATVAPDDRIFLVQIDEALQDRAIASGENLGPSDVGIFFFNG